MALLENVDGGIRRALSRRFAGLVFIAAILHGCGPRATKPSPNEGAGPGPMDFAVPCVGLACQQKNCGELGVTTLVGKVYAPNGTLPLYNAVVYVPNAPLEPFEKTVKCEPCDGHVSGSPLVKAVTGPDGSFVLENVPAGIDIPLVVQIGKWRRQVLVDVPECTTTELEAKYTRLPQSNSEGEIPKIGIATGSLDPMECLLLKIGIDPNEIAEPGQGKRVDFYKAAHSPGTTISTNTPSGADLTKGLYMDLKKLMDYDVVILPCEGSEYDQGAVGRSNIVEYLNAGGRVFGTHYSYSWFTYSNSPFNKIAKPQKDGLWPRGQSAKIPGTVTLVTNFPKGMAFAQWLISAGAKSAPNKLEAPAVLHDIDGVDPAFAQAWGKLDFNGIPATPLLTFNTPLNAPPDDMGVPQYCGRAVFGDLHVAASEASGPTFPKACKGGPLTDQEKALAFMLFDLSSCVQSDLIPPVM